MGGQGNGNGNRRPIQKVSVIVPKNPFAPQAMQKRWHCLSALDVEKLMEWWPGKPHSPHRKASKVRDIQRSLDWKRVAQIAAYLLQEELVGAPEKLIEAFSDIYEPKMDEPGRQWPPKVPKIVNYQRSTYPTFSNVLIHVNGATLVPDDDGDEGAASLEFDENNKTLNFSVIDGQHRINGAYLAMHVRKSRGHTDPWEIPAEIFLDLDKPGDPPRHQAQIFIDVNSYQKKVDRSLVADLFPTARGARGPADDTERSQDIGRRLMLESGPLVGLIQIPGIKYGTKDVVTLATLNSAIEGILSDLREAGIRSLEGQTDFISNILEAWLVASGRVEDRDVARLSGLSDDNVAYQGRVLVSILTLVPAILLEARVNRLKFGSERFEQHIREWMAGVAKRAGLLKDGKLLSKSEFKQRRYLGTGGIGRFRDTLWAAAGSSRSIADVEEERMVLLAEKVRARVRHELSL